MADLYLRCQHCSAPVVVPELQLTMFLALNCPLCHKVLDRRRPPKSCVPVQPQANSEAVSEPPLFVPSASDKELLRALKVGWEGL